MLTKKDLKEAIRPLEKKIDTLTEKVDDLALETKAIHEIIETQGAELEKRIENLEDQVGIN
ncbi:MAG: hypothetical protein A3C30_05325 [Candidatus Levybacteria bacterium RIFCSPHIGHO2_02_FULL_40_18]|nr:MAG: hypothetical protein A2869_02985 [Candidatus Levybacteria bacterium RIFCSPHIGHO2_01_FULL_40_58]OGH26496.1 MAG: hypothetical protein A3C30_05325 [Candidatus Levybacteria bacterium RIFCSPHIGHO2_02_FULL_40_18]OGH31944.1 MAG: hypothetical protein A3E43_01125 [Candidatus Levybacteria bacterium RIFCSPHIGHO2_12_FULL_40_31]OGH40213.1 MAG: hypothetical protein A2894_05220 [Candidatus Levybacteria bacterium RIFCSPLOWO2_01_FULL_40_64]OGH49337.1 MAG: hypothetical protein A3I54_01670 [Candidatus Lev